MQVYERRAQEYTPPKGTHTPDRRKKVRRLKQLKPNPKKRKIRHSHYWSRDNGDQYVISTNV